MGVHCLLQWRTLGDLEETSHEDRGRVQKRDGSSPFRVMDPIELGLLGNPPDRLAVVFRSFLVERT